MKCFNCGNETNTHLCPDCRTESILNNIFFEIWKYDPENSSYQYIVEYATSLSESQSLRDCIPEILNLFPSAITEYYYCLYSWMCNNENFELLVKRYLDSHDLFDKKSQRLIVYLLKKYIPNDFIKPQKWCEWILKNDNLCGELYTEAAKYYAMIGEYDYSEQMIEKGVLCSDFIYSSKDSLNIRLEKQRQDTDRYRTQKPYWPKNEERRRLIASFYAKKGFPIQE